MSLQLLRAGSVTRWPRRGQVLPVLRRHDIRVHVLVQLAALCTVSLSAINRGRQCVLMPAMLTLPDLSAATSSSWVATLLSGCVALLSLLHRGDRRLVVRVLWLLATTLLAILAPVL